ncbi:MAG: glycolate oxidase subunit GlcE [Gammaproteobacteria bacterium]|nr:glycolate oxidase subunit GlcE [Gammaproteobacteria bacterium]MDH5730952.1 glycolate oxidase subunit GlcE [Gammaproteobacteria bacterium]
MSDQSEKLQQQVLQAIANSQALKIVGGDSKYFYGHTIEGELLFTTQHQGILNYEPTELVISARCGTPLSQIISTLSQHNQMLAFEPPAFSNNATLGGTIATNLSGPRRAYAGAARDFVLGCRLLNGKGEILRFGGEVMKNVAGYDVSRLMAGAMGTLGVLLDISLKVVPIPEMESSLVFELDQQRALDKIHELSSKAWPISASCYHSGKLYVRLSGAEQAVIHTSQQLGGETLNQADAFWLQLKEQTLDFFQSEENLWRLSIASDAAALSYEKCLIEWGGALRWIKTNDVAENLFATAAEWGGHATLFKPSANEASQRFQKLSAPMLKLHQQLKQAFDPHLLFNIGKLYPEL